MQFIYDENKMKFHKFIWAMSIVAVAINLYNYVSYSEPIDTYIIDWYMSNYNLDILGVYQFCATISLVEIFLAAAYGIGFFKRTKYSWWCMMISRALTVICGFYLAICFMSVEGAGSTVTQSISSAIIAFIVLGYYYRRKPMFFKELMDAHNAEIAPKDIIEATQAVNVNSVVNEVPTNSAVNNANTTSAIDAIAAHEGNNENIFAE